MTLSKHAAAAAPRDRLIVALDYPDAAKSLAMANHLHGTCSWVKVGLELYLTEGRAIVEDLRGMGFEVFLDLKLHDIPNTVACAVRSAARSGASLLTLHAGGGPAMLAAAVEAAQSLTTPPRLLGVTVLTSMDQAQLTAIGVNDTPENQVLRLGSMAIDAGVDGLVCSPRETMALRAKLTVDPLLVVPGIRPIGSEQNDQKRAETPTDAIRGGASMLVVGRPITRSADPVRTVENILEEIAAATAKP